MNRIEWEIQPSDVGNEISWWQFQFSKIKPASQFEIKFGFTIELTDAINNIMSICKSIDPECAIEIEDKNGFLFPNFKLNISSSKFNITAIKQFAGGSSRERVFNYKVNIIADSTSSEIIKLFQKSYNELGPKPLNEEISFE